MFARLEHDKRGVCCVSYTNNLALGLKADMDQSTYNAVCIGLGRPVTHVYGLRGGVIPICAEGDS